MTSLPSTPYKGTRDAYPEDMRIRNYIFSVWRTVVERHGYQQYDAPLLEPVDVYAAKSGEEIVNSQTYAFEDRGGRTVAIRPEMTPSVSRMVAARRQEIGYPARWYSIAQFMRYERPQRGREREFWQFNVDMFGASGVEADAEILTITDEIMREFGAKSSMYKVCVNHRGVIDDMMTQYLGLDVVQAQLMVKLFDRKGKISHEAFRDQAIDIFGAQHAKDGLQKIAKLITATSIEDLPQVVRESEHFSEVSELFDTLKARKIKNVRFDITLMRGLDYYTGMVFEVFDLSPDNNRSMFGGGRYDGLVGLFGAEPTPTIGFAPGLTTTELFLRSHDLLPELAPRTDIGIVVMPGAMDGAQKLATELRSEGLRVEVDITERKADKQLKAVVKKKIPHIIFVGDNEISSQQYTLKHLASGEEDTLSAPRIVAKVLDYRRGLSRDSDDFDV